MKVSHKLKNAIAAKLYDADGDLSKRWFVYYYIKNPVSGEMDRRRVYEGFAECKTEKERRNNAKRLITKINRQLEKGKDPAIKKFIAFSQDSNSSEVSRVDVSKVPEKDNSTGLSVEHCLNEIIKDNKGHWRKKTTDSYQSQLNIFYDWLKQEKLEGIDIVNFTKDHAQSFVSYLSNELKSHNTTRNNYTINFKSFFNKLKKKGVIEVSAFEDIELVRSSKTGKKPFNKHQREMLKKALYTRDKELWLFVQIIYYCFSDLKN